MYKIVKLVILGLIVVFYSCNRETEKNDLQKNHLKGKVKSVREKSYVAEEKFGKIVKGNRGGSSSDTYVIYDEKGNELETKSFNHDGSLSYRSIFEYKNNKLINRKSYRGSGKLDVNWIYKYDHYGNLIEMIPNKESYFFRQVYVYDDNGNRIEENSFNSDGSLHSKT